MGKNQKHGQKICGFFNCKGSLCKRMKIPDNMYKMKDVLEHCLKASPKLKKHLYDQNPQAKQAKDDGYKVNFKFIPLDKNISKKITSDYQHFIPQLYLKQFQHDPNDKNKKPMVLDKTRPTEESQLRNPSNFGGINGFLAFVSDNNELVNIIDPLFNKIETDFVPILRDKLTKNIPLSPDEHEKMISFLALMHLRTPKTFDFMESQIQEQAQELDNEQRILTTQTELGTALNEHFNIIDTSVNTSTKEIEYTLQVKKEHVTTSNFLSILEKTKDAFRKKTYHVLEFSDDMLVTTDHPCCTWNPRDQDFDGVGAVGLTDTELFFPISPRHCLVFFSDPLINHGFFIKTKSLNTNEKDLSASINKLLIEKSDQYIISNKKFDNVIQLIDLMASPSDDMFKKE